jgi:protein SSD1
MRARRFENGCLALHSIRLHFELGDGGLPLDCSPYDATEANYLIEEVGLLKSMLLLILLICSSYSLRS